MVPAAGEPAFKHMSHIQTTALFFVYYSVPSKVLAVQDSCLREKGSVLFRCAMCLENERQEYKLCRQCHDSSGASQERKDWNLVLQVALVSC